MCLKQPICCESPNRMLSFTFFYLLLGVTAAISADAVTIDSSQPLTASAPFPLPTTLGYGNPNLSSTCFTATVTTTEFDRPAGVQCPTLKKRCSVTTRTVSVPAEDEDCTSTPTTTSTTRIKCTACPVATITVTLD